MLKETEKSENELDSGQGNRLKMTLLGSAEGCLLLSGVALAFIYTAWLGIMLLFSPERGQVLVGMTATAIVFGRAAGMALGYSLALGHSTIILISMVIETIFVLVCYPLFVFSWRRLLVVKFLKKFLNRMHEAAEAHKDTIRKYGIVGLFVFVWFPFWLTGPVVGCVIGFLLGLQVWISIPVALAGTYVAIFGWAFFLHQLHSRVASYSSSAAMVLMGALVIIIIAGHLLHRGLHKNRTKR